MLRTNSWRRFIVSGLYSFATIPSPSIELSTTSRSEVLNPSQWKVTHGRFSRSAMFHSGSMSLLPTEPSLVSLSMLNLTGLNGSMRPGPQRGRW